MDKLLKSLIESNNSIILPGFGSLIRSLSNGNISFNEFLKFNDGVLINALVKEQGITKEEAENNVNAFVEEVKATLSKDGKFELKGIGTFSSDTKGQTNFSGTLTVSAKAAAPTKKSTVKKEKPKKEVAEKIATPSKPDLNEKLATKDETVAEKLAEKQEPVQKQTQEEKTSQIDNPVISKPVNMSSHSNDEKGEDYVHLSQEEIEARHLKRASKGTVIFGILAIVVIAFFSYINPHHEHAEGEHGTEMHDEGAAPHEMEEAAPAGEEESTEEAEEAQEEANAASSASESSYSKPSGDPTNPSMESSIPVTSINNKFYIVSAAFSSADKAKHQARLLMIMDYPAVVIEPEPGKFYACAGGFNDYNQAQSMLADYKAKKSDAWLFTK